MTRPLYPRERVPGTHWIGGWVGPRTVLDAVEKKKIPSPPPHPGNRTPVTRSSGLVPISTWILAILPEAFSGSNQFLRINHDDVSGSVDAIQTLQMM